MINRKKILKIVNTRSIIAMGILSSLVVVGLVYQISAKEYKETIKSAKENLEQTARVVSTNVELSFISVDQTLQRAAERQYFNMLFGKNLKTDMEHNLSLWVNETPHIDAMMLTDENGEVEILFAKGQENLQVKPDYKLPILDHVEAHKNNSDLGMLIRSSDLEQNNRIFASRRIDKIDGTFGGLVVAVIDGNYITKFVDTIQNEQNMKVGVVLDEGLLLIGESSKSKLFQSMLDDFQNTERGSIKIKEQRIDRELQLFSYQHLKSLPLSILLNVDEQDIFASWNAMRNSYITLSSIFATFVATVIFFVLLLDKKMQRVKESEKKAMQASKAKSDFLAKMSHELRTPLNAIIGFSEMLATGYFGKVTTNQVERLNDINMCGIHLLDLISDILAFSKGEAGKLTLKEELINIHSLTNEVFKIVEQKAQNNNVDLVNAISEQVNGLFADKKKIKQILINLFSNSVKFTQNGGKIIISTHFDESYNMVITVSDTGRGIEQKDIARAMEVFEQVHSDHTEEGTGLGLPLCQMFAEMHGGSFRLESKVGIGTTAYVTIPSSRIRQPVVAEELEAAQA